MFNLTCHRLQIRNIVQLTAKAGFWLAFCTALIGIASQINAAEPKKVAFLVGVSKYDKAGLNNLAYAEDDVAALGEAFKSSGFFVETLLGSAEGEKGATRAIINARLETQFVQNLKKINKNDIVLIALSGQGLQMNVEKAGARVEDQFFCPVDAVKTDPATMLSIGDLIQLVAHNSGAASNLFIIDAYHDSPSKGIDGSHLTIPRGTGMIFAASTGEKSYETDKLKHGLLAYYLLEGLNGRAKDEDGEVTWESLATYAKKQVIRNSPKLVSAEQSPNTVSNLSTVPVLVRIRTR